MNIMYVRKRNRNENENENENVSPFSRCPSDIFVPSLSWQMIDLFKSVRDTVFRTGGGEAE